MRIVLGVTGGIASYKAAVVLRRMTEDGHEVHVVPTESALKFVGKPIWEALSGQPVYTDTFEAVEEVNHVLQGRRADLVIIAPATANSLAKAAAGLAPDLIGNILLTATVPVIMAPAMHTEMWENAATQANVAVLRSRSEEHTSELQSRGHLVCRLLLEKKKTQHKRLLLHNSILV